MTAPVQINVDLPEKVRFLLRRHTHKILYGGRGGIKSWSMAQAALLLGVQRPLRFGCGRETMKSLADSVHQVLVDQIRRLHLEGHYRVRKTYIEGVNDTLFRYHSLRELGIHNVKSVEGTDIFWAEEAQSITKRSWETVLPTIYRNAGCEIWVSMNPRFADDDSYIRWILNPPPGAIVVKTSYRDNRWLTQEMQDAMDRMREENPKRFAHIYEGECESTLEGAIYAEELARVDKEQRVREVPYDRLYPVHTSWDLGWSDNVSIWLFQQIAGQLRVLDYESGMKKPLSHYLQKLQSRGYVYGTHYLPWDGASPHLGTGKSIEDLIRTAGYKVRVVPQHRVINRINVTRETFPRMVFDRERTEEGVRQLRRYRWPEKKTEEKSDSREPVHDEASHPADALGTACVGLKEPIAKTERPQQQRRRMMGTFS